MLSKSQLLLLVRVDRVLALECQKFVQDVAACVKEGVKRFFCQEMAQIADLFTLFAVLHHKENWEKENLQLSVRV